MNFYITQVYDDKTKWTNTVIYYKEDDFMIYVGIDIAKQKHYASIMNSDGEILVVPFAFTNNYNGFHTLLSILECYPKRNSLSEWNQLLTMLKI